MTQQDAKRDQLEGILESFQRHVTEPEVRGVVKAIRRGRRRRLIHGIGTAVAAAVVLTGLVVPLGVLLGDSRQGATSSQPSISPDSSITPAAPVYGGSSSAPLSFERTRGHAHGWSRLADAVSGVSIDIPDDWSFIQDPEPDISDPRMLFGTGTIDVIDGSTPCQWLSKVTTNGAVVWLVEWFDVEKLGGSPSEFPSQPSTFDLKSSYITGQHDCVEEVPDEYTIPFQASGRFFWFTVAVGSNATTSHLSTVVEVLSSVKVEEGAGANG